jgi:uncharacterized protein (TIGR00251 family)
MAVHSSLVTKITVVITPNAKSTGMEMISAQQYRIRITAPSVNEKANAMAAKMVAKFFKVPLTHVVLESGEKLRKKTFLVIEK